MIPFSAIDITFCFPNITHEFKWQRIMSCTLETISPSKLIIIAPIPKIEIN